MWYGRNILVGRNILPCTILPQCRSLEYSVITVDCVAPGLKLDDHLKYEEGDNLEDSVWRGMIDEGCVNCCTG